MARAYTLGRRADQLAQTRQRIVEAAVDLHSSVGPANTSLSMVAEKAGVQRNTLYAHFPDERSLAMACSGLAMERSPPPDAEAWRKLAGADRLRAGLTAVYAWYGRNAELLGCVLRDAEHHALTREISELRFGPTSTAWREVLGEGLSRERAAVLHLALNYHSWRALGVEANLSEQEAVDVMVRAIRSASA